MNRGLVILLAALLPPLALLAMRKWRHAGLNLILCLGAVASGELPVLAIGLSLAALAHAVWATRPADAAQAT